MSGRGKTSVFTPEEKLILIRHNASDEVRGLTGVIIWSTMASCATELNMNRLENPFLVCTLRRFG